jgi:hypothetical protein
MPYATLFQTVAGWSVAVSLVAHATFTWRDGDGRQRGARD